MNESLPEKIAALYRKPQEQWGAEEWKQLSGFLNAQLAEARDGWGVALEHADSFLQTIRTQELLISYLRMQIEYAPLKNNPRSAKRRGRPKMSAHDLQNLLQICEEKMNQVRPASGARMTQRQALISVFRKEFKARGLREGRANSPQFLSKIHTLENLLSKARASRK